jgi:hypothetical protein
VIKSAAMVAGMAVCALVSACTSEVDGRPMPHVPAGTVQASFLGIDEVSTVLGTALTTGGSSGEPPPPLTADPPACAVAVGPGTQSVYVRGWTTFRSETFQDANGDYTVAQVLGSYTDDEQARKVFGTLTDGVKGCLTAVRTDADQSTTKWTYAVGSAHSTALGWTATQDAGDGWACYRQARLKGKVVLQGGVCSAGDGMQAATKIADALASRVGG